MPVLAFSSSPLPATADPTKYREGDALIDVDAAARDWVLQLASLRAGRLDEGDLDALQSLLDRGQPEIATMIAAIRRHGAIWVRRR
jgi:hypothetical protein